MGNVSIDDLLVHDNTKPLSVTPVDLRGVSAFTVYNSSRTIRYEGTDMMAARVEPLESELATTAFFRRVNRFWTHDADTPTFANLQDPRLFLLNGTMVLSGVDFPVYDKGIRTWRTLFFKGDNPYEMEPEPFLAGPYGWKDSHMVQLNDGKIGLYVRFTSIGERIRDPNAGRIGFLEVSSLNEINAETFYRAVPLPLFAHDEWGGVNEVYNVGPGCNLLLGHVAKFEPDGSKAYYVFTALHYYKSGEISQYHIIASPYDIPAGSAKRSDLQMVMFPSCFTGPSSLRASVRDRHIMQIQF